MVQESDEGRGEVVKSRRLPGIAGYSRQLGLAHRVKEQGRWVGEGKLTCMVQESD